MNRGPRQISIDEVRGYVQGTLNDAYVGLHLIQFQGKIDDLIQLCLEAGSQCQNNRVRYRQICDTVMTNIPILAADEKTQENLSEFLQRIIRTARNYVSLNQ